MEMNTHIDTLMCKERIQTSGTPQPSYGCEVDEDEKKSRETEKERLRWQRRQRDEKSVERMWKRS